MAKQLAKNIAADIEVRSEDCRRKTMELIEMLEGESEKTLNDIEKLIITYYGIKSGYINKNTTFCEIVDK